MRAQHKTFLATFMLLASLLFFFNNNVAWASVQSSDSSITIDRIQVVNQQIKLLKNRLVQAEQEFQELQKEHDKQISQITIEKVSKNLLDKANLDISVSKSNLDSINIELTDSQQSINWLEKNIQEIENQLNVLNMFSVKIVSEGIANSQELRADSIYQQKFLRFEKIRAGYLKNLQKTADRILQLKKDRYNYINTLLKSHNMRLVKQQRMKDELMYQELQNQWLHQVNSLSSLLAKIDPSQSKESKNSYAELERGIFHANESASYAYIQSLIARYKDQLQQMKLTVLKSNSISLLNEVGDQVQALTKQINRLNEVINSHVKLLNKHINYLSQKKIINQQMQSYLQKLAILNNHYQSSITQLTELREDTFSFRVNLDKALQTELSSRQGLPAFELKTLLDIGKELLLLPALAFQVVISLSSTLMKSFQNTSALVWGVFAVIQTILLFSFFFVYRLLLGLLARPSPWRENINSKWLSLQWLKRNFVDLAIIGNIIGVMFFFKVPLKNYIFVSYLSLVWIIFKSILTVARICLVETTHHTAGHDVKLYQRLRWIVIVGGIIIALTVFVHQLPLIYELKTICSQLFLLFLLVVALFLLRSWDVVPNLVLMNMESNHPYLQKSIRLIGILIPLLILGNSIIGLIGYMNLVMTIAWYEGVFLIMLIAYLILRGLLTDGMEQLSHLMIQYVENGWLWTEAFLKPLDKILRVILFLASWAMLFVLYGWDKQSPIVVWLNWLIHYQLVSILNTTITPLSIIELFILISVFYWSAKWIREFVYRSLSSHTKDMGIRTSLSILSQYSVVFIGVFVCLRVLGINQQALGLIAGGLAFGVGLGLRDLANNFFFCFFILLERPLRVGDIVNINNIEGEVTHIGSRAITVRTWDHMELVVPNVEVFNKSFTNWTARDNIVRTVVPIKISRYDNPHEVKVIIHTVLASHKNILTEPVPEVFLKEINDSVMEFELRYFVNIRQVPSRISVMSAVLMSIWDAFAKHGIKPPYPQHEVFLKNELPALRFQG